MENGNDDILTEIMAVYSGTIINNGMPVLQAIALRMTIALAAIEGGYKIAMDLYSGDKVKFIVATCFKVGFFCFLILEWLDIGQALSGFFQTAGFLAAGESGYSDSDPTAMDKDTTFRPDSIWHNAKMFFLLCLNGKDANGDMTGFPWASAIVDGGLAGVTIGLFTGGIGGLLATVLLPLLFVVFIAGLMIFISVEMFVARIEFYTMMLLSVIFLPFGVTERLAFLSNSAISLMFNSGAKMMVICFLQVMIAKTFSAYLGALTANPFKDLGILLQMLVMCVFFAYITKKIPDLVSSFLNGSPALSGGGMMQQAKSWASTAVTGAAMGAGAMAGGVAASPTFQKAMSEVAAGGFKMSQLSKLPKIASEARGTIGRAVMQNALAKPLSGGFARGAKAVIGQDGTMQDKGFVNGVMRQAGLTDNQNHPILATAAGNPPPSNEKGGGGGGSGAGKETEPKPAPSIYGAAGNGDTINKNIMSQNTTNIQDSKNNNNLYNMGSSGSAPSASGPSPANSSQPGGNSTINQNNISSINQQTINNATNKTDTKYSNSITNMSNLNHII